MPLIDMPIEQLKKYNGINPRPARFDEYWSRAIKALDATDPKPELTPSDFSPKSAECFDLHFIGVGGAKIYAKLLRPKSAQNTPVILQFHGYTGSSGDWFDKLCYVAEGFTVLAMDVRGQGGKSEDNLAVRGTTWSGHIIRGLDGHEDDLFFRNVFLDTAQLARVARGLPFVDAERIFCTGGSQGGALSTVCAALAPDIVKRAVIIHPFLSDYKRVYEMDLCMNAYADLAYYFRTFDPTMENAEKTFEKLGYIDIQFLASRIKASVFFATGLMDQICPPSAQMSIFNKIQSPKHLTIYPNHGHEGYPKMHDRILDFLNQA